MLAKFICSVWRHKPRGRKQMYERECEPENGYVTKILFYEQKCARCGKELTFEVASFTVQAPAPSPY